MYKQSKKNTLFAIILIVPSMIGMSLFYVIPVIQMLFSSFMENEVHRRFVGFSNYIALMKNESFQLALKNSCIFLGISVPILLILSLLLALTIQQEMYGKRWIMTAMILPMIIPVAVVSGFFRILFMNEGGINQFLFMIAGKSIDWEYSSARRFVILMLYIWKNIGYNMVLLLAGLSTIPKEYYEVASLFGAGRIQKFKDITLIYLSPTLFFVVVISMINSFKVFKEVYAMDGAYPNQDLYLMQHYLNNLFNKAAYQRLVTAAILFTILLGLLLFFFFRLQKYISNKIE